MSTDLNHARQQIASIDKQLIDLLKQRQQAVAQVAKVKIESGAPLYAPEREAQLVSQLKNDAEAAGISASLIEDIMRRIFRESYQQQTKAGFKKMSPQDGEIVIVGGAGRLGRLLQRLFACSGFTTVVIEKDNFQQLSDYANSAQLVIVSVPIAETIKVIGELPRLNPNCILADVTSCKSEPVAAMLKAHQGPVVGLHPMFAPNQLDLAKQLVVVCHGRGESQYQWLLQQIKVWGCLLTEIGAEQHDALMGHIQGMRHLINFAMGSQVAQSGYSISQIDEVSSPIYRMELALIGRLFAQNSELYADIWLNHQELPKLIEQFIEILQKAKLSLVAGNKAEIIEEFTEVADYLGDWRDSVMNDSEKLLQMFRDQK